MKIVLSLVVAVAVSTHAAIISSSKSSSASKERMPSQSDFGNTEDQFQGYPAIDIRPVGAVCLNNTYPYRGKDGFVYQSSSCDQLRCPKGYLCQQAIDYVYPFQYFVCCNETYSERFTDVWRCPNGNEPALAISESGSISPIWAEKCTSIDSVCTKYDANYSCLASTGTPGRYGRCCPTTWRTASKTRCPIGNPYKNETTGRQQTCGYFFRRREDKIECPTDYACVERAGQSYCCLQPDAPPMLQAVDDWLNDTCYNATEDFGQCFDASISNQQLVLPKGSIAELTIVNRRGLKSFQGATTKFSKSLSSSLRDEDFFNISAHFNITAMKQLRDDVCENYTTLGSCLRNSPTHSCEHLKMLQTVSLDTLGWLCVPEKFEKVEEALMCFVDTTQQAKKELAKCGEALADRLDEDLSFGLEYIFRGYCRGIQEFAACAAGPMDDVCGDGVGKQYADFLGKIFGDALSSVVGLC